MIDPIVYVAVAIVVGLLLFGVTWFGRKAVGEAVNEATRGGRQRPRPTPAGGDAGAEPGLRMAGRGAALARRRMRRTRDVEDEDDDDDASDSGEYPGGPDLSFEGEKIGAKKLKKLQEKQERKAAREAEMHEREEKKKRQEEMEKLRKEEEEREKKLEEQQAEEERKRKEEQEKKEHEEYLKMKEMFSVEEEGQDAYEDEQDPEHLLQIFIDYVKENKVVMLEDLAAHFKLKTQECIDRVTSLLDEERLTGVMDDRGKFIYITMDELQAVGKFIKQRGRVSIAELAECSNKLIRLTPEVA